ncbi:protein RRP5 homolog [Mercenaria mercenaria]|uniref:protein RRP5 homolog n=1 Tax=Mercenaria mercenaria TaxID=6596 RepID=UPI00234F2EB1|nr:protein RRP5 homolog [Mercenaria mercenaria]
MEEENFPRGGVKKAEGKKNKKEPNLFQDISQGSDTKKKQKKQKKGGKANKDGGSESKKKHKMEGQVSGQMGQEQPQFLSKKFLYPGMLMLGYVKQIKNYALMMALPNGLSGTVPITNISQAYTESLQRFSEAQDDNVENVSTLAELFKVGMVMPCKLTELDKNADSKSLTLTINPKDVNGDLSASSLRHGMCVYGNVSSQEDHGYIIDIGVKGVQVFLKNKHASRYIQLYNNDNPLGVGQCLMCKIKMKGDRMSVLTGQNRVVNVTIDPLELKNVEGTEVSDVQFTSLVPGMKVHAKVEKVVKDDGIVVEFHKLRGLIHKSHLPKPPGSYSHAQQVTCCILYIHPLIKAVTLTLLPHLTDYVGVPTGLFGKVKVGQTIEEATVKKTEKKRGVFLDLQNNITGFAGMSNLSDDNVENVQQAFKKGSTHRCRVLGFYPMEALVIVTMKQSVLDEKYMRITDVKPGDILDCKVKKLEKKGISVEVHKGIMGMIPTMQMADVTLQHPEQKFKADDKIKCRVLFVNKKRSNVTLTHKKSLINSKYPVISNYHQIEVGQILEGYISAIKDFGCFVRFYSDVMGLTPRAMLSTEPIEYPEKVFFKGQVVRCKVVHVNPPTKKLTLTFVLEGKTEFGQRTKEMPKDFKAGKKVKCKVLKKTETGVDVELVSSHMKAFLPKTHLSDSMEMCDALWNMYKPGDVIEHAMYWHKSKMPLLTCKPCLLTSAENEEDFVTTFDPLTPGMMLPGVVRNIMSYGIFVEFANGLFGLVPMQYAVDKRVPDIKVFYQPGQTVVAKVVEVNKEKQRFLASLRMKDCYHGNTEIGIELTWNYLKERKRLLESLQKTKDKGLLTKVEFGSVHKVTITKVTKIGAICELENGIKAIVTKDHMPFKEEVSEGQTLDSVVLYVDLKQNCVEVSLDSKLVPPVKKRLEKDDLQAARVDQILQSKVVLIKDDFIVVKLSGHAKGQLAYLPARRHWNDVLEKHQYTVGQENKVKIKRVEGDLILASLKVHEDKAVEDEDKLNHVPSHSLNIGDICDATVRKVYKDQIYINVNGTHGRVHVTEMFDHVENGSCPPLRLTKGQEVKVRVIGFRDNKSKKYLPISHPKLKKAMPDCTMKPSILSLDKLPDRYSCTENNYSVGDKVVAYVDCYSCNYVYTHVSPSVRGKVHLLNMSSSLQVLKEPGKHFRTGQVYNATVINIYTDTLVELSLLDTPYEEVCLGKETQGVVCLSRKDAGLVLQLRDDIRGTVDLTDISDNYVDQPTEGFKQGDILTVKVLELDKLSKQAVVTLRPDESVSKPVDERIQSISDLTRGQIVRGYIMRLSKEGITVRLGVGVKFVLSQGSIVDGKYVKTQMMKKELKVGNVIRVKFLGYDKNNEPEWSMQDVERIPKQCLSDTPIRKNKKKRKRSVSNSSADSEVTKAKKTKLKNIETLNEIDENIQLEIEGLEKLDRDDLDERDSVTNSSVVSDPGMNLSDSIEERIDKDWKNLKISVSGVGDDDKQVNRSVVETDDMLMTKEASEESDNESISDSEESSSDSSDNEEVERTSKLPGKNELEVISKKEDASDVSEKNNEDKLDTLEDSDTEANLRIKERLSKKLSESTKTVRQTDSSSEKSSQKQKTRGNKRRSQSELEGESPKKKQKESIKKEKEVPKETVNSDIEVKVVTKSDVQVSEKPVLEVGDGFSWDTDFKLPSLKQGEISSDDSDDEGTEKPVKKSKEQIRQEKKEEEKRIYQAEMQRLEGEVQPETADDFDRLVLQSPNSSLVWLNYMAFHLGTTEIDKARAVAERALKTISFREEQEKLNVWVAYLNLENMYGTAETVRKVLTRAVQQNDQISIYLQMINIYVKSGKTEDGEQLFNTLVKKHSGNKDVWIKFGEFYFQQGRVESARKLLQRCMKSLDISQHVDTIVKFAQMEFKHGEPERGKTMFENILSTYPKRTDLWSVYIDLVTKLGELDTARSLFNRVIQLLSAKKVKFFFRKYLQFENKHGSEDQVAEVKRKALHYVESQGFVDQ